MAAPVLPPTMRLRDRLSLRLRMARARRAGTGARRAMLLGAACASAQGGWVASVVDGPASPSGAGMMGEAELRLFDGAALDLGLCHAPTVARLRRLLADGPVIVERLADHGRCWGVYLRTAEGPLALLAARLDLTPGHGGDHLVAPPLARC